MVDEEEKIRVEYNTALQMKRSNTITKIVIERKDK